VDSLVNTSNGLSADLVLLGRYMPTTETARSRFFQNLPTIYARLGVYGVRANATRESPETDLSSLVKAMTVAGVQPLVNGVAKIK
jgi:hypothetical protein